MYFIHKIAIIDIRIIFLHFIFFRISISIKNSFLYKKFFFEFFKLFIFNNFLLLGISSKKDIFSIYKFFDNPFNYATFN